MFVVCESLGFHFLDIELKGLGILCTECAFMVPILCGSGIAEWGSNVGPAHDCSVEDRRGPHDNILGTSLQQQSNAAHELEHQVQTGV